jgi:hypothetical protein
MWWVRAGGDLANGRAGRGCGGEGSLGWTVRWLFRQQTGDAGVGVIIRNHAGEAGARRGGLRHGVCCFVARCASADEAESQACAEGLRLASQMVHGLVIQNA